MKKLFLAVAIMAVTFANGSAALVVFDDFNVNEGHFNQAPNFSGSNANVAAASTAVRVTTGSFEGAGNEQIVITPTTNLTFTRLRFLSGSGTPANNTTFSTGSGTDGWIGLALKTTSPGWNAQLWIEPSNLAPAATGSNGSVPKNIIADGLWHIYEWNLDDNSGGPNGWGTIAGVATGVATVGNGNHTIDSVLFRHNGPTGNSTIFMDIVARNTDGTLSSVLVAVPEAGSFAAMGLVAFISAGAVWFKTRRTKQAAA